MFVRDVKDQSTNVIRVGKKKNPEGRVLAQFMNLMAVLAPPSPDPLGPWPVASPPTRRRQLAMSG